MRRRRRGATVLVLHAWLLPSAHAKKVLIEESATYAPVLREIQDIKDYLHS